MHFRFQKVITVVALLAVAPAAFATGGIDCRGGDTTLEISTNEAAIEGDNVISLTAKAPWIQAEPIVFEKIKGEVKLKSLQPRVYRASKDGITFEFELGPEPIRVANVRWTHNGQSDVETLACPIE